MGPRHLQRCSTLVPSDLSTGAFALQLQLSFDSPFVSGQLQFSSSDSAMETCTSDNDDRVSPWILWRFCIRKRLFNGALQHYQESRAQLDFTISGVRQLSRIWSRRADLAWPSQALLAWKTFTSKQVRTFSFWRPSRSVWDHPIPSGCLQSVCSFKPCLSLYPFPNDAKV